MEDHHVDRPEVKAEQSVELTGTNRSMALIPTAAHSGKTLCPANLSPQKRGAGQDAPVRFIPAKAANGGPNGPQTLLLPSHMTPPEHPARAGGPPGSAIAGLVAIARGQPPDPIPNSAVKTLCANGTAPQGAEESVAARPAIPLPLSTFDDRADAVGPNLESDQAVERVVVKQL